MELVYTILLLAGLTPLMMVIWGTFRTLGHLKKNPPKLDAPFGLHPVSVIKPIRGADSFLENNLESFFRIQYPEFEILFCIADENDPATSIVRKLQKKYPKVNSTLIIGDVNVGANPKVNNMVKAYAQAQFDWLLISDSNVYVQKDYIKRLVAHVENDTGIVTALVAGRDYQSLGGELEAMYLNSFYARWMLLAQVFNEPIVVGKSMLFKRSVANRFGGIKALACYLAEDYMAGQAMKYLGYKVVIAHDPVHQPIGEYSVQDFWRRHIRWGRIRKSQAILAFIAEPLMTPFVSAFFTGLGFYFIAHMSFLNGFVFHLLAWSLCDIVLHQELSTKDLSLRTLKIWCLRELLHLPLWMQTICGSRVYWRGQYLKVKRGGTLEQNETP